MKFVRAIPILCLMVPAACAQVEVRSAQGQGMFVATKGACFVGCNIRFRFADGATCRGFAPGMEEEYPFFGTISCADAERKEFQTEKLKRGAAVQGRLDGQPVLATLK